MNVTIRGTLEQTDYVRAMRLTMRPRRWLGVLGVVLAVVWGAFSIFGLAQAARHGQGWLGALTLLAAGLALLYYFFIYLPQCWRTLFEQQKSFHLPLHLTLDADGIESRNELGYVKFPWTFIRKWRSDRHVLLLYHSDAVMHILPKRLMTDVDVQVLESQLRERFGHA